MKNRKIKLLFFLCISVLLLFALEPAFAVIYTYDELNRLTTVTYDSGQKIQYTYDAAGNIVSTTTTLINYIGDVDNDGDVNADDAAKILRYIVLTDTLTENEREMADVDGDGLITALDASYILKKAVGLIDKFPAEK